MNPVEQTIVDLLKNPAIAVPLFLWQIIWKGVALWKAASKRQLLWFAIIFVINTLGLLEIGYIFYFNRKDIDNGKVLVFLEKTFKKKK